MSTTLLIGESKSGKTKALETLPRGLVDFSFDRNGWQSIKKKKVVVVHSLVEWLKTDDVLAPDQCLVVDYAVSDPIELHQYTRSESSHFMNFGMDANALWLQTDRCKAKGICHVCIDSLTSLQSPIGEFIRAMNSRVIATQQDWGQIVGKIDEVIQSMVGLPFDFILIAHIQAEKDEVTGRIKEVPLVYGKQLPNQIMAKFDDIFLTVSERGPQGMKYEWATAPEGLLKIIGTRSFDNLPSRIPPDFAKLYGDRLYKGEVKP